MAETKALDAKLRARGSKKLSEELDALFKPVLERANGAGNPPLAHTAEGSTAEPPDTAYGSIEAARQALELALLPIYEQQEVDAFLSDVDGLRAKIDEIDPRR